MFGDDHHLVYQDNPAFPDVKNLIDNPENVTYYKKHHIFLLTSCKDIIEGISGFDGVAKGLAADNQLQKQLRRDAPFARSHQLSRMVINFFSVRDEE